MSVCDYRRSSETMLHKVDSCKSGVDIVDDQVTIQLSKSASGPIQQPGEFSVDRANSPRTKNLYRFTLNENLLTMKVTDDNNPETQEQKESNSPPPNNEEIKEENPEEEKKPPEEISKELKELSSQLSLSLQQSEAQKETEKEKFLPSSDHFNLRSRYPHSFNDIPNQSSFQHRFQKQCDIHNIRSNDIHPTGNRSHGDLNLKALLQREDNYLKSLRLNGDLRHKYTYMSRPFGIWNHQYQMNPKREHFQSLMKLMKMFNPKNENINNNNSNNAVKLNKSTDMFDSNQDGDNKSELKVELNENESRVSNESIDPMDIHRLKTACKSMCNQLNEIHTTISYVHGDLKNLIATISPTPSMCLMEEIAELREAYEVTANNDRKRDMQMRQIEVQLHDICNKLEKVDFPKKNKFLYTYLLVPVIGCVALCTIALLGDGKREIPIDVVASTVMDKVVN